MNLHGKNILITGGSLGIGFATARTCLEKGGRVLICARGKTDIEQAVATLKDEGYTSILGKVADVTKIEEIEAALGELEQQFGPLTSVIHSAGVYGPIGKMTTVSPEEWWNGVHVNLFGSFLVARQSCLRMQKNGGGRLVLLSGGGASGPFPNYTSYASSKAAIVRFTETIAEEMAPYQIEVNCLGPGFVLTRLHQQTLNAPALAGSAFVEKTKAEFQKGGVPPEVGASAAAFLISDAAKGITGKFISAPYDSWESFPEKLKELQGSDLFTLRRILPKDRGQSWQ